MFLAGQDLVEIVVFLCTAIVAHHVIDSSDLLDDFQTLKVLGLMITASVGSILLVSPTGKYCPHLTATAAAMLGTCMIGIACMAFGCRQKFTVKVSTTPISGNSCALRVCSDKSRTSHLSTASRRMEHCVQFDRD